MKRAGRRRLRGRTAAVASAAVLMLVTAATAWGTYTGVTSSPGNSLTAATDWVAPSASASVIGKSQGGIPGYIHQGGGMNVYANATDTGGPASGIANLTAGVSSISATATASLSAGSYSIGGTAYGYRSGSVTARTTLAEGNYAYSLTTTDAAGNPRTQTGYTVVVDNTAPTATGIQTANRTGNIVGRPDQGDSITYTFSEQIDPNSILPGWNGTATNVVVRMTNVNGDPLTVFDPTNATQLPLGSVNMGRNDYVILNTTFGATGTPSTMTQSGSSIVVTLGTPSLGPAIAAGNGTMVWTLSNAAIDRAGNGVSTVTRTETGSSDREF